MEKLQETTFCVRGYTIPLIQNGKLINSKRFTDKSAREYASHYVERNYYQLVKRVNLEAASDTHPSEENLKGFPRVLITGSNAYQKVLLLQNLLQNGFQIEERRQMANCNPTTDYSLVKSDEMQLKEITPIREAGIADYREYVNEFNLAREMAIEELQDTVKAQKENSDRVHAALLADKARENDLLDELLKEIS